MSNPSIEDALASGDPELMDQVLAGQASEEDVFVSVDGELVKQSLDNTLMDGHAVSSDGQADTTAGIEAGTEAGTDTDPFETEPEPCSEPEQADAETVILGKSGKHEIPYSVLEEERRQLQETRQALESERLRNQELEQRQHDNETAIHFARQRLEAAGMDVNEVFSDPDALTEQAWNDIIDDYGPLGKAVQTLFQNQAYLQQIAAEAYQGSDHQPGYDPSSCSPDLPVAQAQQLEAAIRGNADISRWQDSDPDRWAQAVAIDNRLRQDPAWAGKSMDERFAEVAKQTRQAFGDDLRSRAQAIIDQSQPDTPTSLSDIGHTSTRNRPIMERINSASDEELMFEVEHMSDADLDSLFGQGF